MLCTCAGPRPEDGILLERLSRIRWVRSDEGSCGGSTEPICKPSTQNYTKTHTRRICSTSWRNTRSSFNKTFTGHKVTQTLALKDSKDICLKTQSGFRTPACWNVCKSVPRCLLARRNTASVNRVICVVRLAVTMTDHWQFNHTQKHRGGCSCAFPERTLAAEVGGVLGNHSGKEPAPTVSIHSSAGGVSELELPFYHNLHQVILVSPLQHETPHTSSKLLTITTCIKQGLLFCKGMCVTPHRSVHRLRLPHAEK